MGQPLSAPPTVYVDESGNSGQNLLDAAQPVFVLAAVHLPAEEAHRLASALAGSAAEAHYTRLRKKPGGRQRILQVLEDPALDGGGVRVSTLHKPYMATAKFVDLLIEPLVAAHGHDFYEQGMHVELAQMLYAHGPLVCTQSWAPLMHSFVEFIWRGTREAATGLIGALEAAATEAGSDPVGDFVALAPRSAATLMDWHGRDEGEEPADALDPALTATVEQVQHWGDEIGPFLLVYDQSKVIARWQLRLQALADPAVAAQHTVTPTNRMPALRLAGLTSAESHDSAAIQIADLLAGACADLLKRVANGTEPDEWGLALREAGVLRWVEHLVWPADAGLARELEEQRVFPDT